MTEPSVTKADVPRGEGGGRGNWGVPLSGPQKSLLLQFFKFYLVFFKFSYLRFRQFMTKSSPKFEIILPISTHPYLVCHNLRIVVKYLYVVLAILDCTANYDHFWGSYLFSVANWGFFSFFTGRNTGRNLGLNTGASHTSASRTGVSCRWSLARTIQHSEFLIFVKKRSCESGFCSKSGGPSASIPHHQ